MNKKGHGVTRPVITASAAGSLFLMGEHSVLQGELAIAGTVDKRITVDLIPRSDKQIFIDSSLGEYQSTLSVLADDERFRFVLCAIRAYLPQLPGGFSLAIMSEFSHEVGLGSSAAVTVACCGALAQWVYGEVDQQRVFATALTVMKEVQNGKGSGADIAACVVGGLAAYRIKPLLIEPLEQVPDIRLLYAGYKMKTPDVIRHVERLSLDQPEVHAKLYAVMGAITEQAVTAIKAADWSKLGALMNTYHGLMDALGVNDSTLSDMVFQLREQGALGAKISGSGLGDCVIGLFGTMDNNSSKMVKTPYENIAVKFCSRGLEVDVTKND